MSEEASKDTVSTTKYPAMVVVDDRHSTAIHPRRKSRFKSIFGLEGSPTNNFHSFEDRQFKKARRRHLWGNPGLGSRSVKMTCSNCRHAVDTIVVFEHTWRSCLAIFCFTAVGLCFIPAMCRLWQDGLHYCPLCHSYLGHSQRQHTWRYRPPAWVQRNRGSDAVEHVRP